MLDTMARKKKPDGDGAPKKPVRTGVPVHAWVDAEVVEALDKFVSEFEPRISKTSAVEAALKAYLRANGYWPPRREGEVAGE